MKHDLLETLISISLKAGDMVRHSYEGGEFGIAEKKDSYDLVTNVDHQSQKIIQEELYRRFPDIPVLGEEDSRITKRTHAFFIDPLDGTLNFVKQIPFFSVSIGYWKDNEPVCGAVYDPLRHDIFYARKNHGAYRNGKELQLAGSKARSKLLASDWGHEPRLYQKNIEIMQHLMKENSYLFRFMGCASLGICYVGAGFFDGYWHYKLAPWDMAAGVLIAQEAGASVSRLDGSTFDLWGQDILAVAPHLKNKLNHLFQQINLH